MSTILKRIGELLKSEDHIELEKFEDVKDASGNLIRIDKYEVGGKVQLISTDGSLIDVPDGEYTLEDGRTFTVTGNVISGISQDVKEPDATQEVIQPIANEMPAENITDEKPEDEKSIEEDYWKEIEAMKVEISDMKSQMEEMLKYMEEMAGSTAEFKEIKKKMSKEKEELEKKVTELEKIPAGDPINIKASKIKNVEQSKLNEDYGWKTKNIDYAEKYKQMLELQKEMKNKK